MKEASSKHQNNDGTQCDHFFFPTDPQMLTEANAGIPSSPPAYEYYTVKILAQILLRAQILLASILGQNILAT